MQLLSKLLIKLLIKLHTKHLTQLLKLLTKLLGQLLKLLTKLLVKLLFKLLTKLLLKLLIKLLLKLRIRSLDKVHKEDAALRCLARSLINCLCGIMQNLQRAAQIWMSGQNGGILPMAVFDQTIYGR